MSLPDAATSSLGTTPNTAKLASQFKILDPVALNFGLADNTTNTAHDHGNTGLAGNEFVLAVVSLTLRLPGFWMEWPATWFNMCESAFAVRQIASSTMKYHYCVGKLPAETVAMVEDLVNNHAFNAPTLTQS